jgi:Protein of unknown function (DUF2852)
MASFAARLEELPRPIWCALAILGFIFWWPLGLAVLAYCYGAGKWLAVDLDLATGATIRTASCRIGGVSREPAATKPSTNTGQPRCSA